jgi:hypothetical protein
MLCNTADPKIYAPAVVTLGKENPLLISRRREAKRRALLQMLDRIPVRAERPSPIAKPAAAPADVPLQRNATGATGIRGRSPN